MVLTLLRDRATCGASVGHRTNEFLSVGSYLSYSQKLEDMGGLEITPAPFLPFVFWFLA
jgi:hypothetical protein